MRSGQGFQFSRNVFILTATLLGGVAGFSNPSFAEKTTVTDPVSESRIPASYLSSIIDADTETMMTKAALVKKRKPASDTIYSESDLDKDVVQFREKFLAVQNADQLEALLADISAGYKSYSPSLQYFTAQMAILTPLRGIVWRMRPLLETGGALSGLTGTKAVHSSAVTALRGAADLIQAFMPTSQWKAGFDFVTTPSAKMKASDQFHKVAEFQEFQLYTFAGKLAEASSRISTLLKANPTKVFVWDNKINFGPGTFDDGIRRYVGHGAPEMAATIGGIQYSMSTIFFFSAYNQDEAVNVARDIGRLIGIEGFVNSDLGMSEEAWNGVMAKYKKTDFLKLRTADLGEVSNTQFGAKLMKASYRRLRDAISYYKYAYTTLQGAAPSTMMTINPVFFKSENDKDLQRGVNNAEALVTSHQTVRSPLTGEHIDVDLPSFYNNPPQDMLDLLPNKFDTSEEEVNLKGSDGKEMTYRNYYRGRATGWDNSKWATYIPSVASGGSDSIEVASRVIRHEPGAASVLWPLLTFMK